MNWDFLLNNSTSIGYDVKLLVLGKSYNLGIFRNFFRDFDIFAYKFNVHGTAKKKKKQRKQAIVECCVHNMKFVIGTKLKKNLSIPFDCKWKSHACSSRAGTKSSLHRQNVEW